MIKEIKVENFARGLENGVELHTLAYKINELVKAYNKLSTTPRQSLTKTNET